MQLNPRQIFGPWDAGFTLDLHIKSSEYIGDDDYGHPQFDTTRTELGELLYKLKYQADQSAVAPIARAASGFVESWKPGIELIVPVPPSKHRSVQPLFQIADEVGRLLDLPVDKVSVRKTKLTPQLKNVEHTKRLELLAGAHSIQSNALERRRVLLLDDPYQSGATLTVIARLLKDAGCVSRVFALALTRARG